MQLRKALASFAMSFAGFEGFEFRDWGLELDMCGFEGPQP